jgi:putative nucleotidyltransferase with HDIG domain
VSPSDAEWSAEFFKMSTALPTTQPVKEAYAAAPATGWTSGYNRLWQGLMLAAVLTAFACVVLSPLRTSPSAPLRYLLVIGILALIINMMPVALADKNFSTSPLIPLIYASVDLYGAFAGMTIMALCSVVFGIRALPRIKTHRWQKVTQVIAGTIVTDGICSLAYVGLKGHLLARIVAPSGAVFQVACWMLLSVSVLIALLANGGLQTYLASRYYGHRWDVIWHENVRWTIPGAILMSPVAYVTAVLFRENVWLGVGFVVLPLMAGRAANDYHVRTMTAYKQGVEMLGRIMQESHPYTHGHLHRVARWAKLIAEELKLSPESIQFIQDAAVLHDIGKVAVDDRVLNKVGTLTDDDWSMIRRHPEVGAEIVGRIQYFSKVSNWIRHHHERPDGSGYPDRMEGDDIPLESCIISVVDAYDAMVGGPSKEDKRPYRKPLTPEDAIAELRRNAGTQFNERVVTAFVAILMREIHADHTEAGTHRQASDADSLWDAPVSGQEAMGHLRIAPAGGRAA